MSDSTNDAGTPASPAVVAATPADGRPEERNGLGPAVEAGEALPRPRRRRRRSASRPPATEEGVARAPGTEIIEPSETSARDGENGRARPRTKSAGGRSRASRAAAPPGTKPDSEAAPVPGGPDESAAEASPAGVESRPRRSRSAGPRTPRTTRRPRAAAAPASTEEEPATASVELEAVGSAADSDGEVEQGETDASEGATTARRRRRRRRGGRGRSRARTAEEIAAEETTDVVPFETDASAAPQPVDAGEAVETSSAPTTRTRTRTRRTAAQPGQEGSSRRPSRSRAGTGESVPADGAPRSKAGAEPASAQTSDSLQTTRRRRRAAQPSRRRRESEIEVVRSTDKSMLITEIGDRDQIAVVEDRMLVEHYITRAGARSMVGNIYLGKVQNVLPGMEAAFVDVGRGRNAVLYAGEVSYDEEIEGEAPRIEKVLRAGQNVLVQVTKDPMGGKGARLTQEISLPGRFLVLVPTSKVFGISRRLPERERARLKDFLKKIRPPEHGLIVRTAAEGAAVEDLQADLERLIEEWGVIAKSAKRGRAPRGLYEEPELTVRVVRDLFTGGEFREMVTDSIPVHDQVVTYLKGVAPDLVPRVKLHQGPLSLFEDRHLVEQIHKALDRKVWLASGGYLVIDRTEALTVIDVNTGKHVGKANLEETVTKTNLEAAEEAARQLRLRDIGGIIIVDFIDMLLEKNKDKVLLALKTAMAQDKTRSQVFDIGPLGLAQVTRKRVSAGLLESFSETCPTCEGRGILLTYKL